MHKGLTVCTEHPEHSAHAEGLTCWTEVPEVLGGEVGRQSCSLLTYTHLTREAQGMGMACLNPHLESDLEEIQNYRPPQSDVGCKSAQLILPGMVTFILKN